MSNIKFGDLVLAKARVTSSNGPIYTVAIETSDEVENVPVRMHSGNTYGVTLDDPDLVGIQGNIEMINDGVAIVKIRENPMSAGGAVLSDPTHIALKLEDLKLLVPSLKNEDGSMREDA